MKLLPGPSVLPAKKLKAILMIAAEIALPAANIAARPLGRRITFKSELSNVKTPADIELFKLKSSEITAFIPAALQARALVQFAFTCRAYTCSFSSGRIRTS